MAFPHQTNALLNHFRQAKSPAYDWTFFTALMQTGLFSLLFQAELPASFF